MLVENCFSLSCSGVIAKKNLGKAKQKTFVGTSAAKIIPLPLLGSAMCCQVVSGLRDGVSDTLMCQLSWHSVGDFAAAGKVCSCVKLFLTGAPVKVL